MSNGIGAKPYLSAADLYGVTSTSATANGFMGDSGGAPRTTGQAATTMTSQNATASNTSTLLPGLQGTLFGQPITHLIVIVLVVIGAYYVIHRTTPGIEKELATPRIGIGSFFSIGVQALVFLFIVKTLLSKWQIPGLTQLVLGA